MNFKFVQRAMHPSLHTSIPAQSRRTFRPKRIRSAGDAAGEVHSDVQAACSQPQKTDGRGA